MSRKQIGVNTARSSSPAGTNFKLARTYNLAAAGCVVLATAPIPYSWLATWPAFSLTMLAAAYRGRGVRTFAKNNGQLPLLTRVLHAPFLTGSKLSLRWMSRAEAPWVEVVPGVLVGRKLTAKEGRKLIAAGVTAVLDVTSEYAEARPLRELAYLNLPLLDHTAPTQEELTKGVAFIRHHTRTGKVYVHCALGYSRSVAMVTAYLLAENLATDVESAIAMVKVKRPCALITRKLRRALAEFHACTATPHVATVA